MSINRVVISGNLTRDPEFAFHSKWACLFWASASQSTIAARTSRRVNGKITPTSLIALCSVLAHESVSRFLGKGSKVAIEGKLRWSQWERDGQKRSKIEVIVDEIEFMTSRNDGASSRRGTHEQRLWLRHRWRQPRWLAPVVDASSSVYDDDIPF